MSESTALILNNFSHKSLDVVNGSPNEGEIIQQFQFQGTANQRWLLINTGMPALNHSIIGAEQISANLYYIVASHSHKALSPMPSNRATVAQFQREPVPLLAQNRGQLWQLVRFIDGSYVIMNVPATGRARELKVLSLVGRNNDNRIALSDFNQQDPTQRWEIFDNYFHASPDFAIIFGKSSHLCLDVPGASLLDDVVIQQFSYLGQSNQRWVVERIFQIPEIRRGEDKCRIRSLHSSKALDISQHVQGQTEKVVQRGTSQRHESDLWQLFHPWGDTFYYKIRNVSTFLPSISSSGKVLDVLNGAVVAHAQVQLHDQHNGDNQLWEIWYSRQW